MLCFFLNLLFILYTQITNNKQNQALGVVGTNVTDGPNKIYIGSIPPQLTDDNVKEILSAFGQLKAFNLVRDPGSVLSKGYAFCEYTDASLTQVAIEGLNGLPVADKQLQVRVANLSAKAQQAQAQTQAQQSYYLPGGNMASHFIIIIFYFNFFSPCIII